MDSNKVTVGRVLRYNQFRMVQSRIYSRFAFQQSLQIAQDRQLQERWERNRAWVEFTLKMNCIDWEENQTVLVQKSNF